MTRPFLQVDVFAAEPLRGNPVAVVLEAPGLADEAMQRLARWTNLSETVFLLPPASPEADYRLRIFTPTRELPFAGHPTLGACHAWLEGGGRPRQAGVVVQECGAGLVHVRRGPHRLAFEAPPLLRSGPVEEPLAGQVAGVLGVDLGEVVETQWVDNGPGWMAVLLRDADAVLALEPDAARFAGPGNLDVGVVGPYPPGSECAFEVRAFLLDEGATMSEDPVTGSLNASLAQWLLASGRASAPYVASQGARAGRLGRVHVEEDPDGTIWVGGETVTYVRGEIEM